ncbi:hypothetical protein OG535_13255 [Kitasatospora sp. NBC_00085]|uniref:hypothetical protein n=1 Tax=Kitasatospora sp. NBC_00085 TaxID=2903566 RepID=UPI00324E547F
MHRTAVPDVIASSGAELIALGGDHEWHDADRRTARPHLAEYAALMLALPPAPAKSYTGLQLDGGECAVCGADNGPDVEMRNHAITLDGHVLHACYPACPPQAELLPPGIARAETAIRDALTAAVDPDALPSNSTARKVAQRLFVAVTEELEQAAPSPGRQDWQAADRASTPFFNATCGLIGETMRRHVEGAQMDGINQADAARQILHSLFSACNLYAAEYLSPQLFEAEDGGDL